jgi:hypothetical protein
VLGAHSQCACRKKMRLMWQKKAISALCTSSVSAKASAGACGVDGEEALTGPDAWWGAGRSQDDIQTFQESVGGDRRKPARVPARVTRKVRHAKRTAHDACTVSCARC